MFASSVAGRNAARLEAAATHPIYLVYTSHVERLDDIAGHGRKMFGTHGSGKGQFQDGRAIALDKTGRIYVADAGNHRIVRIDDMTGKNWIAYGPAAGNRRLVYPSSLAVDSAGRVYIADNVSHGQVGTGRARLLRINDMRGAGWTVLSDVRLPSKHLYRIDGIVLDRHDRLYILDHHLRIIRIDEAGGWSGVGPEEPGVTDISSYEAIALDAKGRIYVTDVNDVSSTIRRWDGWNALSGAGKDVHFSTRAWSNYLGSLSIDSAGRIYALDRDQDRVYRIDDMHGAGLVSYKAADPNSRPSDLAVR